MNRSVEIIPAIPEKAPPRLHPAVNDAVQDLTHAVVYSLSAVIGFGLLLWVAGFELELIIRVVEGTAGLGFVLVAFSRCLHLLARNGQALGEIVEAWLEIKLRKDLNRSGAVGDRPSSKEPPETPTTETPAETIASFMRHVSEFREMVEKGVKDTSRSEWLAHKGNNGWDMPAYQWRDRTRITKAEHKAICDFLTANGLMQGRTKGRKGAIVEGEE